MLFFLPCRTLILWAFIVVGCMSCSSPNQSTTYSQLKNPEIKQVEIKIEKISKAFEAFKSYRPDAAASKLPLVAVLKAYKNVENIPEPPWTVNKLDKMGNYLEEARLEAEEARPNAEAESIERNQERAEKIIEEKEERKRKKSIIEKTKKVAEEYMKDGGISASFQLDALVNFYPEIKELEEIRRKAELKIGIKKVLKIPASDYHANLSAYRRLLELDPENKKFQAKIKHYAAMKKKGQERALRQRKVEDLCFDGTERSIAELRRRGAFSHKEWTLIDENKFRIGSRAEVLACAWGRPKKINRSVGINGVHRQWVYPSAYVYTENGVITGWQD